MKSLVLTLFIIPFLLITQIEEKDTNNIVVLELFTSQGCSSCPPADELLKEVKSDNVIVLSYHVDYWNYIGWKDPFSKASYSNKQRQYATKFNSSTIYTPQLVVNGKEHFVGSKQALLKQKIAQYSKIKTEQTVALTSVTKSDDYVSFDYAVDKIISDENIRVVLVINKRKTFVKRGENRNRELVNSNIVVAEQQFKLKGKSGKGSILIPEIVNKNDELSLVVTLQNDKLDITTAAQKRL